MIGIGAICSSRGSATTPIALPFDADWSPDTTSVGNATVPGIYQFNRFYASPAADRLQFVTSPVRQGTYSLRMECRQGDSPTTGRERTQIEASAVPKTYFPYGDDYWVALSLQLDASLTNPPGTTWDKYFFQLWGGSISGAVAGGGPPIGIFMNYHDQLGIVIRGGAKAVTGDPTPDPPGDRLHYFAAATRSVWHDILIHVVSDWNEPGSAVTELYHRLSTGSFPGSPDVLDTGANLYKIGSTVHVHWPVACVYRSATSGTDIIYNGGVRVGETRVDAETLWA